MRATIIIYLLVFIQVSFGQNITVNPELTKKNDEFIFKVGNELKERNKQFAYMEDGITIVKVANSDGFTAIVFELVVGQTINPRVYVRGCLGSIDLPIEKYWIEVDKKKYNAGDTLSGTVYLKTLPSEHYKNKVILINGNFSEFVSESFN